VSLLEKINFPSDLRKLEIKQLDKLAMEIREFMLDTVSKKGGHLAPSLGAVEIALALHYCFNTPVDKLVWDVGHQAYAHKIITGRRNKFNTLRQYGGISGFPRTTESDYDAVSTGHASTSISAALGIAKARDIRKKDFNVVAVIGDGSISAGLAFEGLNNLGISSTNMTVVLNDNEMSIARNVGALSKYLTRIITDKRYNKLKTDIWELLGSLSNVGKKIRSQVTNLNEAIKHFITPGKFFEDIGIRYIGPVDGHNIRELIDVFKFAKESKSGPILIHALTKKGKGYSFAEVDATKYHGIGKFSKATGSVTSSGSLPSYSDVFGKALVEIAEQESNIVAITAAMPDGTGLQYFRDRFPERLFDVGIAEGHAVTFAAGLARQGVKPVVTIYSTFLQRAFDHIIHDVALDNLDVLFCLDRAGIVGADGPTHHGSFDLSYLRTVPGATIMAPSDEQELRNMLYTAIHDVKGPVFIRYPRGIGRGKGYDEPMEKIPLYQPRIIRKGKQCAILSIGSCLQTAETACDTLEKKKIKPTLVDARFAKPLDEEFYLEIFNTYKYIITLENNARIGGFGTGIMELASTHNKQPNIVCLGYPDEFVPHGSNEKLLKEMKLSPEDVAKKVKELINK
jgi:1-deoxy-D-xylulose-5-phosphate synthase